MISLCIFGNIKYSTLLRFLTVYFIYNNEEFFKKKLLEKLLFQQPQLADNQVNELLEMNFIQILYDARMNGRWCNQYYLMALSSILNMALYYIYIYSNMRFKVTDNCTSRQGFYFSYSTFVFLK